MMSVVSFCADDVSLRAARPTNTPSFGQQIYAMIEEASITCAVRFFMLHSSIILKFSSIDERNM